ncbi:HAM1 protein [Halorhabdus tiamatea SARL4B]|uniref:HAM1 protein n=1 Tax=Halorhabdus tiamatea SARL4B TaxID=1033806 RepID=F7PNV3_9EURY|nr:RdgB/HAM1 family non-canonical purine NTP pyrophosphatase [Halorhabdus tiamatea]ERJ06737.1 HAM1 protein [Halorhabdus tiamatea SARL4B]CCQ33658.1 non-canonical purine NTP pyrophosphatase, rdgB/HAM1 family protein [Halorhabdus tiamatea SARL4B]
MLRFVTGNDGKVREARAALDDDVTQFTYDYPEIQSPDLGAIAAHGAREAYREVGAPVMVEDSGLFVDAFAGFPGPYSAYVEDTLGIERVWRLTEPEDDHAAAFRSVIAYCDGSGFASAPAVRDGEPPVAIFEGRVEGTIVAPRGDGGFGYDPIFEYDDRTFAEMDPEEKNEHSHRGRAIDAFVEWYDGQGEA